MKKPKATWVKPIMDAEIEYGALTDDGLLREAVFKRLRDDLALPAVHTPVRSGRAGVPRENILQLLPDAVAPSKDELAGRGTTAIGAYSPRAREGFPVAAPVTLHSRSPGHPQRHRGARERKTAQAEFLPTAA